MKPTTPSQPRAELGAFLRRLEAGALALQCAGVMFTEHPTIEGLRTDYRVTFYAPRGWAWQRAPHGPSYCADLHYSLSKLNYILDTSTPDNLRTRLDLYASQILGDLAKESVVQNEV